MEHSLDRRINYMTLIKFALPTIISNVFMSIYSTIDGIFVANLVGTNGLSAINIVMPFLMISISIGTMIGTGGSALIAKKLGEGKKEEARKGFTLLLIVGVLASAIMSTLGLIFMEGVLNFLGAEPSIYELCVQYAKPIFIMLPSALLGILFQMFFIAEGRPNLGMIFSIIGGVINIVLDYVLIAHFDMGIQGAALATGIGYSFPAFVGLFFFAFKRTGNLYFVKPEFDGSVILKAATNGSSEMVTMLSSSIITITMNNIMMRLAGVDGVSAITIIIYIQMLLSSVYIGYASGISPITSYNYGKQDTMNLKKIYKISLSVIISISVFTFLISNVFAHPLVSIFASSGTYVYDLAKEGLLIFTISFLFMGFNVFSSALFTALNDGKTSALLSFFRTLVFLFISLMVFPSLWNVTGVWIATPIAEALSIMMSLYYLKKMKHRYGYA